jgi:ABC-type sugar transport system ATPase subunit
MKVYREPANQFVAGFIGSPQMNFLPGPSVPGGHGENRIVGVRPHDLTPTTDARTDGFRLTGELALIEPAGPVHYLDVLVGGQMVKATCSDPAGCALGERLTLTVPDPLIYLFDRDSGTRL